MTDYTRKIIENMFTLYEERKKETENVDIEELTDEIMDILNHKQKKEKIIAHLFICQNKTIAQEVNVFPKNYAYVVNNLLIIPKVDDFFEKRGQVCITINNEKFDIPQKYSYSFSFVEQ